MPHRYFHGKTGRVFNVGKRAIGVVLNKYLIGQGRIREKKVYIRIEHIVQSKCRTSLVQ